MIRKLPRLWRAFLRLPDVLKLAIVMAILFLGVPAFAGERFVRQGADEVRISDSPCVSVEAMIVIDKIEPGKRGAYQKAVGKFGGKTFFGCWRQEGEFVQLVWEDGDVGFVPMAELKAQPEA